MSAAPSERDELTQPLPDTGESGWTPILALRFYSEGRHFDTVGGKTRILDTGAVASDALKSVSEQYRQHKGVTTSPQYSALADELIAGADNVVGNTARNLMRQAATALRAAEALEQRVKEVEVERDKVGPLLNDYSQQIDDQRRRAEAAEQQLAEAVERSHEWRNLAITRSAETEAAEAAVAKAREGAYEHIGWIQMIGDKPKMCFNEGTRDPRTVHDNGKPCFPVYALRSRTKP